VTAESQHRLYHAYAIIHRPKEWVGWKGRIEEQGVTIEAGKWLGEQVRDLTFELPPPMSPLAALTLFRQHAQVVEIVAPLLAAAADDLERAKSDLDRAVAMGASDAELTYAIATSFEARDEWDAAVTFWERLSHILPDVPATREHLAIAYARLGVFVMAATEFDRAAQLAEEPEHREKLLKARDLMKEQSRV
jgi:hypothetical protein